MKTIDRQNYLLEKPPTPIFRARLENMSIVPASLLACKKIWHELTNSLPKGSILICHDPGNRKQKMILDEVGLLFSQKGYYVKSVSIEEGRV